MHINLYLVPFVIILGMVFGWNDTRQSRKWYIILCSAALLFVASMRSAEYMTLTYNIDTLNYKAYFENSFSMGWDEFQRLLVSRYVDHEVEADAGFFGFLKIIGLFTKDFYLYSLLANLFFFIPFGLMLYRFCTSIEQIIFAFVFYIALFQIYLLGGGRQVYAIGFDIMALLSIIEEKRFRSIVYFLISVTLHFSALLFAIPLMMIWFRLKPRMLKIMHIISFILFPLVLLYPRVVISFMGDVSGVEKYQAYGDGVIMGGASTFIILIALLSFFCLIAIKIKDLEGNDYLQPLYVMTPLLTFFAPLIRAGGTMTRIALYYYLFLSLLVPFAIDCMFKGKERGIIYVLAIVALAFLTVSRGGISYYFYWQV